MGRVYQPKYAWTNNKGERIERTTKTWYIEYFHNGRTIRRKTDEIRCQSWLGGLLNHYHRAAA